MPSVFDVLGQDHQEVRRMLSELEKGPTVTTGASDNHLMLRKKMVEQLIIEESKHEALEEMYFWPVVRDRLPDGYHLADTATGQEQEGKQVLAAGQVGAVTRNSRGCSEGSSSRAGSTSPTRNRRSGRCCAERSPGRPRPTRRQDRRGKKTAPTGPTRTRRHHRACSRGPVAAAADKARDKLTGRGSD